MFDRRLISLVDGSKGHLVRIVAGKWVALLANISIIWMLARLTRDLLAPTQSQEPLTAGFLWAMAAGLALAIAIRSLAVYGSERSTDKLQLLVMTSVRQKLYDKFLELGSSYQETVSLPEAMQTAGEGVTQLQVYFARYLPQLVYAMLAPITLFAVLVWKAGWAAVLLILLVPLIPVSMVFVQKPARRAARRYWESYVDLGGEFLQAVSGLTTLKVFQADGRYAQRLDRQAESFRKTTMNMLSVQLRSIVLMDLFAYGGAAGGIMVALYLYGQGAIGYEGCFLLVFLSQEFFLPMRQLGSLFHAGMGGMAASRKMHQVLDAQVRHEGRVDLGSLKTVDKHRDIRLEQVGYEYGQRQVLSQIDLTIPERGMFALVGESGSGKSTLAAIIAGRKRDYAGKVSLGLTDYRSISDRSLMEQVTLVDSRSHLFATTIRENLLMAAPSATDQQLYQALDQAQVGDFVRKSGGLDLVVQEGGSNLSQGQIQRIALARALLHDSPVYIFDEVTSNVDIASERAIARLIAKLAETRCCVVIAHRLELVEDAATICVMDQGRVVQSGTHEQLLAESGPYSALWRQQVQLLSFCRDKGFSGDEGLLGQSLQASMDACEIPQTGPEGAAGSGDLEKDEPMPGWKVMVSLMGLIGPLRPYLILAVALGSLGHLLAIALPSTAAVAMMGLGMHEPGDIGLLRPFFLILAICGLLRGPLRYGEQLCNHYIAFRILAHIRHVLFGQLRKLAPACLEGRGKGDILTLVTSDVELLEVFFAHTISPAFIALLVCMAVTGFVGAASPLMAATALGGYLTVGLALPWLTARLLKGEGAQMRQDNARLGAYVLDQLKGIGQTIQYGQGASSSTRFAQRNREVSRKEYGLKRGAALNQAASSALQSLACLVFMAVSFFWATSSHEASSLPWALVASMAYFSSFGPVMAVSQLAGTLPQTVGSGQRVMSLLTDRPSVEPVERGVDITFQEAGFDHVDFGYGSRQVLNDVNLHVGHGQVMCISGPSGSGKSTLLKLLMRFWDVDRGSVEMNLTNVKDVNTVSLRNNQAYMTQDTFLFEGSIKDNILLVKPDATDRQLMGALASAHLEDFISQLPLGLDTQVGDLEDRLSGGERQRIGLARAFLYNAPLILLDEPTSNLDALSEASVMKAIAQGRSGKTFIIVSHRPSTAAFADRFVYVDKGHVK